MKKVISNIFDSIICKRWFISGLIYLLLLINFGYRFGSGDQIEIIPTVLQMQNLADFSNDFFIGNLGQLFPNERFSIALLFYLGGENLEYWVFFLHFITTISLIWALFKIGDIYIENQLLKIVVVVLTLGFANNLNIGGNELYYNNFQASNIAKAIATWGLFFFLIEHYLIASLLIGFAAIFHPIAGLVLFILLVLTYFISFLNSKTSNFKEFSKLILPFCFTGGIWILLIYLAYHSDNHIIEKNNFFEIIFKFRNGHHYDPLQFPLKSWIYFTFISIAIWFLSPEKKFRTIFISCFLFLTIYFIGFVIFKSPFIASFQAFKVTIWFEFLAFLCLIFALENYLNHYPTINYISNSIIILFVCISIYKNNLIDVNFKDKLQICKMIEENTKPESIFIVPFKFTELQSFAKRPTFVSWHANLKHKYWGVKWFERINLIYGVNLNSDKKKLILEADEFYYKTLSVNSLKYKFLGIEYALTEKEILNLKPFLKWKQYFVYKL